MSLQSLFSTDGRSYAFDSRANGYGRGEGAGAVFLKPLSDALRDNDQIRAVIVGTGMNQDGRTNGITMPNGDAQLALMKQVYSQAEIEPTETGYVEAHGTGTKAGDPIEATALHEMFGEGRTARQPLYMGSVKSNVGHLEGASGIVSLIKTAMMLEKGYILPNYNFEKGNPKIPFSEWNFRVPKSLFPWPKGKKYASINSFGFGGANVHAVLERGPRKVNPVGEQPILNQEEPKRLFVISGNDKESVMQQMNNLTVYLEHRPEVFQSNLLGNLAYTLGQRRSVHAWKFAFTANSSSSLITGLASGETSPIRSAKEPRIGFVYTGQGAQWHGMGRELMTAYPIFKSSMEQIDQALASMGADFSIINELSKDAETSRISDAHISQPGCTAVQLALTNLFWSWGIHPNAVAGHSSGEIGAAYAAGALTIEDAMAIAYHRGQSVLGLKKKFPDLKGGMMAVGASPEDVKPLLKNLGEGKAVVACINSPSSITASGDVTAIDELQKLIEEKQMFNRKLRVDTAYHSHHMDLVADDYRQSINHVTPKTEAKAVFHSSLVGEKTDISALIPSYWVSNLTSPVRFSEAVQSMCAPTEEDTSSPGVDIIVELGPHAALEGPVKQILKSIGAKAVKIPYASALLRNKDAVDTTLGAAGSLFMKGAKLKFPAINFAQPNRKIPELLTDLPKYSWNHTKGYWHECRISEKHRNREFARNDIVGTMANYSNDLEPTWRNIIRADDLPWVRDHRMQDMTVYPMAGYLAMAMEAVAQRAQLRKITYDKFEFREVTISRPLVIQESMDAETNITLRPFAEGLRNSSEAWDEFRIFSWAKDRGWIEHCRGLITTLRSTDTNAVDGPAQTLAESTRLMTDIANTKTCSTAQVDTKQLYQDLEGVGCSYGPTFQGLENCSASDTHAVADLVMTNTAAGNPLGHEPGVIIHPAFFDQFIQSVWPILGAGRDCLSVLFMPRFAQRIVVSTGIDHTPGHRMKVYAKGNPDIQKPVPTKFTMFATSDDGAKEYILMEDVVMAPVADAGEGVSEFGQRELCYKMNWEPLATKGESSVAPAVEAAINGTTNGVNGIHAKSEDEIVIICDEASQKSLASSIAASLEEFTSAKPAIASLANAKADGKIAVVIQELHKPLISELDATTFEAVQKLAAQAKGIVWAVRGAYTAAQNPDLNMAVGMARSIRSETLLKFVTVDFDAANQLSDSDTANKILEIVESTFKEDASGTLEMEYQERSGALFVPRVTLDTDMNAFVEQDIHPSNAPDLQPFSQPGRPLKIDITTKGALDTLHFVDDAIAETPLPADEVSIEVKVTSMNFKDIMIAMGEVPSKYIGVECAGVIAAVGSSVTDLKPGDRVCAMSEGAYSTFARCKSTSAQKIPDALSFEDAATIPVVFCTAYYSLFDIARLTKGETVLIHAAAGGVGQAAIMLAKMVGAEIFTTVGSPSKKSFLMNTYGIPEDHIFYSRDTSFAKAIHRATNGVGVDVVLNSLAGDCLRATWDSLAHFGRFVEIGKRDIVGNSRLDMARFEHNALFASVDLTVVAAERPKLMKRVLSDVFNLIAMHLIKPISPITAFPISSVEAAFRTLQAGKAIGKIVLTTSPDDQVKAVPLKTPKKIMKADATYLLVGGTGGIGRSIARWMVGKGAKHIVLLSRTGKATGKVAELIEECKAEGAEILVHSCDVSSKQDVEKLINEKLAHLPPVRGVIHGAMVLNDVLFEKMTFEQWQTVVQPKVAGAWNLHNALTKTPLDFFVALSSVAGAVGNQGQAAYSAANVFLDAFVQYRRRLGLAASAINLAAVSDVGYLADNSDRQSTVVDNLGGETISEREILALLAANITGKSAQFCNDHVITGLKLPAKYEDLFWSGDAKFSHLCAAAAAQNAQQSSATATVSLRSALKAAASYEQSLQLVCDALMTKTSAVLMLPREEFDPAKQIVAYGLDSLVAIEIRNWITRELDASLQVLELLTSSSFWALAALVLKKSKLCTFEPPASS